MSTTLLPPGVHPQDRRSAPSGPGGTRPFDPSAQPQGGVPNGRPRFNTPNGRAMGVFQRAASTWTGRAMKISSADAVKIVGRKRGREQTVVWVPKAAVIAGTLVTVTNGVLISMTAGEANSTAGVVLGVGDSISIGSEGPIYVKKLPGKTTGICQFVDFYNPSERAPGT